ncbi:hypothetical protein PIB30_068135, partial [Stylosanthes scabra]|nr:hypothetical protein [Stylosanthes scabra]
MLCSTTLFSCSIRFAHKKFGSSYSPQPLQLHPTNLNKPLEGIGIMLDDLYGTETCSTIFEGISRREESRIIGVFELYKVILLIRFIIYNSNGWRELYLIEYV